MPSEVPSVSSSPTPIPFQSPTVMPSKAPSIVPSSSPISTLVPTQSPSPLPTKVPTIIPTMSPTINPTNGTVKLDFGNPGLNIQDGFLKLGLPDGGGGTYYGTFPYLGQTSTIQITGYTHTRGDYMKVVNSYARLSNLLRSSFLRNFPGVMHVEISGLKQSTMYEINTYHHSTSYPRGGVNFSLQYEGNNKNWLKQSARGQNPDPPLIHSEIVQSSTDGIVRLVMNSAEQIGGVDIHAHLDLNGMEIKYLGPCTIKLDFGNPGVNVQEGFLKLGVADGGSGLYSSAFQYADRTTTIKITGYTHTRGNYIEVVNSYAKFSNLLRSSFLRNLPGIMKVEISGLKPSTRYEIKTYHHSTSYPRGGISFYLKYDGNVWIKLKQSANGQNPDPPLMHSEIVLSSTDGIVRLVMNSEKGTGGIQINAHMDLNGMEIKFIG